LVAAAKALDRSRLITGRLRSPMRWMVTALCTHAPVRVPLRTRVAAKTESTVREKEAGTLKRKG